MSDPVADPVVDPAVAPVVDPAPAADPAVVADPAPAVLDAAAVAAMAGEKEKPWFIKRIDDITSKKSQVEEENASLKAKLEILEAAKATEGVDITKLDEAKINAEADRRAAQRTADAQFNKESNDAFNAGQAEYGDFRSVLSTFTPLVGPGGFPRETVEAMLETGAAHRVIYELSQNLNEAQRILSLPPARQAVALAKIASTAKPGKTVSTAAAPITPLGGGKQTGVVDLGDDSVSIDKWMAKREADLKAKNGDARY